MDDNQFWAIIENSRQQAGGHHGRQIESLCALLNTLPESELVAFQQRYEEKLARSRWQPLAEASFLIGGGCADFGFVDFRAWLISQGREVFTRALAEPDSLADVAFTDGEDCFFEEMHYVARQVYQTKTGRPMPLAEPLPERDPPMVACENANEHLHRTMPRLHKLYGDEGIKALPWLSDLPEVDTAPTAPPQPQWTPAQWACPKCGGSHYEDQKLRIRPDQWLDFGGPLSWARFVGRTCTGCGLTEFYNSEYM